MLLPHCQQSRWLIIGRNPCWLGAKKVATSNLRRLGNAPMLAPVLQILASLWCRPVPRPLPLPGSATPGTSPLTCRSQKFPGNCTEADCRCRQRVAGRPRRPTKGSMWPLMACRKCGNALNNTHIPYAHLYATVHFRNVSRSMAGCSENLGKPTKTANLHREHIMPITWYFLGWTTHSSHVELIQILLHGLTSYLQDSPIICIISSRWKSC